MYVALVHTVLRHAMSWLRCCKVGLWWWSFGFRHW